jgi:undecaprenyl-phosphate 4-deoxy-4-formamido-L-arabinose transferase
VIPCYRSEHTIGAVVKELTDTLKPRADEYDWEIVLVNDGSPDNTAGAIRELCKQYAEIVFVDLSRNFGQHSALMAGFHQVRGDIIICLDDDGQTPACECFKLIDKVNEGNDIVFAEYGERGECYIEITDARGELVYSNRDDSPVRYTLYDVIIQYG